MLLLGGIQFEVQMEAAGARPGHSAGRGTQSGRTALWFYAVQLLFNFFFNCGAYLFAFFWLLALWVLVFITAVLFFRISRPAGWLLAPYLVWISFAGYLNFGIYLLN